jgi:hypothetical protein
MNHEVLVEHLLSVLVGVTPDILADVLAALDGNQVDLSGIPEEAVVDTIVNALTIVGGAAVTGIVHTYSDQVRNAVRRSLAGPTVDRA